ncbi:MAG: hypothetical protein Q4D91_02570 [Lautropia sp.]|nr:hypothetical protein [Lautropia sp.]
MSKKSYRAPLTAAALTILLAACGSGEGGAGSQHSMDSSPAVKEAAAQATAQAAASATATAGGDANAAPAPAGGDANAAPAPAAGGDAATPAAGEATPPAAPPAAEAPGTPAATPEAPAAPAAPGADAGTPATPAPAPDPAQPAAPAAGETPAADATAPAAPAPGTDAGAPAANPAPPGADAGQPANPPAPGTAPAANGQPADGKPTNTATEAAAGVPPVTPDAVVTAPESVPTAQPMAAPANLPSVGNNAAAAAAPALDAAAAQVAANVPAAQSAPITSTGIRGDVLKTMLDQKGCDEPVLFTALDGERVPQDQYDMPSVRVDARIKPENYAQVPNPTTPNPGAWQFDPTCSTSYYTYQSMNVGEHELTVYSNSHHFTVPTPQEKRSLNGMTAKVPVQVSAEGVTLGKSIQVSDHFSSGIPPQQITAPEGPTSEELTLTREADFSFKPQSHISYGVLAEWKDADKVMRLMLFPGKTEGEARLCWNSELSFVRRLQCKVWTAPEGWQDGQPLKYEGQYLVDDRSVYPGEEGLNFWKTRPMPAEAQTQAQAEAPAQ